jgi:hypothetical protein
LYNRRESFHKSIDYRKDLPYIIGEKVPKENPCLSVFLLLRIGLIYVLSQVPIKHIEINRAPKEGKGEFYKKGDRKATP